MRSVFIDEKCLYHFKNRTFLPLGDQTSQKNLQTYTISENDFQNAEWLVVKLKQHNLSSDWSCKQGQPALQGFCCFRHDKLKM